jgi:hypothetical protein
MSRRPNTSIASNRTSRTVRERDSLPRRRPSRVFSRVWLRLPIAEAPNRPARPLRLWIARNAALSRSGSVDAGARLGLELEQGAREGLDDLLRLGDELGGVLVDRAQTWAPPGGLGPGDGGQQVLRGERLGQHRGGAELEGALDVAFAVVGGDDDERGVGVAGVLADRPDELEAVDVRHVDVGDHEVVVGPREQAQRVEAVLDLVDGVVAGGLEDGADERSHGLGVLDEQYPDRHRPAVYARPGSRGSLAGAFKRGFTGGNARCPARQVPGGARGLSAGPGLEPGASGRSKATSQRLGHAVDERGAALAAVARGQADGLGEDDATWCFGQVGHLGGDEAQDVAVDAVHAGEPPRARGRLEHGVELGAAGEDRREQLAREATTASSASHARSSAPASPASDGAWVQKISSAPGRSSGR